MGERTDDQGSDRTEEDATQREADAGAAPSEPPGPSERPPRAPAPRTGAALDDDSPESIRLTFALLTALAACICILPRQWMSAAILGGASAVLLVWHLLDRRRLKRAAATSR